MSQNGRLLAWLEQHPEGITQLGAFNILGICRLSERIREIERVGVEILHEPVTVPTREGKQAHVICYKLQNSFAYG